MQSLPPEIDELLSESLALCAGASLSVAILAAGGIATGACGRARLSPERTASPQTRYAIGSVAKQFTAAAAVLLEREGRLSLDEPVARWLPRVSAAEQVTLRDLLSHRAGFVDHYSLRHAPAAMLEPTTPQAIAEDWGSRPLEFAPREAWRYSNTGYLLAGLVLEAAAGEPLGQILETRLFSQVGMSGAGIYGGSAITDQDAQALTRVGLGAARPARLEGSGWLFAAAGLAARACDLALWNRALLGGWSQGPGPLRVLAEPAVRLGERGYGLGLASRESAEGRTVSHAGQIQGFQSENRLYPDAQIAITVLTNTDSGSGCAEIADRLALRLIPPGGPESAVVDALRHGRLGDARLTDNARWLFDPPALRAFGDSLRPLGPVRSIHLADEQVRGGMAHRNYVLRFVGKRLSLRVAVLADGRIEELHACDDS